MNYDEALPPEHATEPQRRHDLSAVESNPYQAPEQIGVSAPRTEAAWYAVQQRWLALDYYYKFYIAPAGIYGGFFNLLGPTPLWPSRHELLYDQLIASHDEFLAANRRNLFLPIEHIHSIKFSPRNTWRTFWTGFGVMKIYHGRNQCMRLHFARKVAWKQLLEDLLAAGYPAKFVTLRI